MKEYSFTLKFNLPDARIDPDSYVDRLYESGCDDALIGIGKQGCIALDFMRSAASAFEAIASAIVDVKKVIATSRRRERHRYGRRIPLLDELANPHNPEAALCARSELTAIRRKVGDLDYDVLTAIAAGYSYRDVSRVASMRPGAIRQKILRIRVRLTENRDTQ